MASLGENLRGVVDDPLPVTINEQALDLLPYPH